jgi:hypothetical protein
MFVVALLRVAIQALRFRRLFVTVEVSRELPRSSLVRIAAPASERRLGEGL